MHPTRLALLALPALLPAVAAAQSPGGRPDKPPVTAGVGAIFPTTPYKGVKTPPATAVPFVNLNLGRFFLQGVTAGYRLTSHPQASTAAIVQPRFQSYNSNDSDYLEGMGDRNRTAEAGLSFSSRLGRFGFDAGVVSDLLDVHGGQEANAALAVRFGGPVVTVAPGVGVNWQSAELVDYYYGVRPQEARADRPAYAGSAAVNRYARLLVRYRFAKRWGVLGLAKVTRLDNAIYDSPLVNQRHVGSGVLAVTYSF
jgi:outer membrane protein